MMYSEYFVSSVVTFAVASLTIFLGMYFHLFVERLLMAYSQHRVGPGRRGELNVLQTFSDFFKVGQTTLQKAELPFQVKFVFNLWKVIPVIFVCVMVTTRVFWPVAKAELALLLLLMIAAIIAEVFLISATLEEKEKYKIKQLLFVRLMGATSLVFSIFPVILKAKGFSMDSISELQVHFPFHLFLMGPGLFVSSIVSFLSIYFICGVGPLKSTQEQGLLGASHYTFFLIRRLWILALLVFWLLVFGGGSANLFALVTLPVKFVAITIIFYLLEISLPQIRSADAEVMLIKWMVPISLISFVLELVWLGASS